MRRFLLALVLTLIPASGWAQEAAEKAQATFRSGVDLVTVVATVRDSKGRLVKDLTKGDFMVIDRGQPRAINEFRSEQAPVSLAILFDVSGSMSTADRATAAKFAAFHILSSLEDGRDEAGLGYPMAWVRHHDRYEDAPAAACCKRPAGTRPR